MKKNKLFLVILSFCALPVYLFAQDNGITEADVEAVDTAISSLYGGLYSLFGLVNVDSSVGNYAIQSGKITDPYSTLKNCFIFTAKAELDTIEYQQPKGFIGIFKDSQIIWYSDTLIYCENISASLIYATLDLNCDHKVDILTSWLHAYRYGPQFLWIFSWDGQTGNLMNNVDHDNEQSVIFTDLRAYFDFVDVEGDGILEIQSIPDSEENKEVTFSWNGQKYGNWPETPQPSDETCLPRNKIDINFQSIVQKSNNLYSYQYIIENKETSIQKIDAIYLECGVDSIISYDHRYEWDFYQYDEHIGWISENTNINHILPNDVDSSCVFECQGLPILARYYVQGYNKWCSSETFDDLANNSASGITLSATKPPDPFIVTTFVDTLISYKHQVQDLGWITNQGIVNSLGQKLENAKKQLEKGKTKTSLNILNAFLNEVEAQKDKHLTSEAYALLRFNAEYLIKRLEEE